MGLAFGAIQFADTQLRRLCPFGSRATTGSDDVEVSTRLQHGTRLSRIGAQSRPVLTSSPQWNEAGAVRISSRMLEAAAEEPPSEQLATGCWRLPPPTLQRNCRGTHEQGMRRFQQCDQILPAAKHS